MLQYFQSLIKNHFDEIPSVKYMDITYWLMYKFVNCKINKRSNVSHTIKVLLELKSMGETCFLGILFF